MKISFKAEGSQVFIFRDGVRGELCTVSKTALTPSLIAADIARAMNDKYST